MNPVSVWVKVFALYMLFVSIDNASNSCYIPPFSFRSVCSLELDCILRSAFRFSADCQIKEVGEYHYSVTHTNSYGMCIVIFLLLFNSDLFYIHVCLSACQLAFLCVCNWHRALPEVVRFALLPYNS